MYFVVLDRVFFRDDLVCFNKLRKFFTAFVYLLAIKIMDLERNRGEIYSRVRLIYGL